MSKDYYPYADARDKEHAYRMAVLSSLAAACHPDHLNRTLELVKKLQKHMKEAIKETSNVTKTQK